MAEIRLRDDQHADAEYLNRIAVAAFDPLGTTIATGRRRVHGFCEGRDAPPIFGVAYPV